MMLFLAGSVGGILLDQIHVVGGVLSYAEPVFFGQAWWVGPQYGLATVLAYLSARLFLRGAGTIGRSIFWDSLWFVAAYFSTAVFQESVGFLILGLLGTWIVRVWFSECRLRIAVYSLLLALVGLFYEFLLTNLGVFSYSRPQIGSVVFWLPFLYLHAGIFALSVTMTIERSRAAHRLRERPAVLRDGGLYGTECDSE
jgi:hypothetical protein